MSIEKHMFDKIKHKCSNFSNICAYKEIKGLLTGENNEIFNAAGGVHLTFGTSIKGECISDHHT